MATLKATCLSFNRLATPTETDGVKNYYAIIDVDRMFDLTEWRGANLRDAKASGRIPQAIFASLQGEEDFFLINRGLTISASAVRYDNQSNTIEIDVTDKEIHGLLDGGHTYKQLQKFQKLAMEERGIERQFVKVEIITALNKTNYLGLVDGRNTSTPVRSVTLENVSGTFDELKEVLRSLPYFKHIAWSEYEEDVEDGKGVSRPISVLEILKCLVSLDSKNFGKTNPPVEIATRDNKTLEYYKEHKAELRSLYPLLPDVLRLWDTIQRDFVSVYARAGGHAGKIGESGDKIFKGGGKPKPLYYLGITTKWTFPESLKLPILSSFRATLRKTKGGQYSWLGGINPSEFFTEIVGPSLTSVVCENLKNTQDPTRTSRTPSIWSHCFTETRMALLETTQKVPAIT